jgi:BirA family biotin operon repressor/biotin-[acetyl-CoA-carboxylase] ligase
MADFSETSHDVWTRRHYAAIGSTNDAARLWARENAPNFACISARAQSDGHGRRGRSWNSPPDRGVYLSAVLRPNEATQSTLSAASLAPLTIIAALAVARAIEHRGEFATRLKWPNDVSLRGQKIAGVLCEGEWRAGRLHAAVIGIGLNCNHRREELPARPIFPASSLFIESGREWDIEAMTKAILDALKPLWRELENGGWDAIRADWESRCEGLNTLVSVSNEGTKYFGVMRGLDLDGALLLATADGPRRVMAGDIAFEN